MYKEYVIIGDKIKRSTDDKYYKVSVMYKNFISALLIESASNETCVIPYAEISELWRTIKDFKEYEISACGQVRTLRTNRIMKRNESNTYVKVDLYKSGLRKAVKVHRLVAETFIPNPYKKPEVNHKNGNKHDNRVSNLEWMTHSENIEHSYVTGIRNTNADKHEGDIIREVRQGVSLKELCKKYRTGKRPVMRVLSKYGLPVTEEMK